MVLVCGFGLFWIGGPLEIHIDQMKLISEAALLAWRSMSHRAVDPATGGELTFTSRSPTAGKQDMGYTGSIPFPCSKDDLHCVVEDWFY